jgi:DNA-binding NarL/FixJ family response regulator
MLSVLLIDDHVALREGLEVLLERRGVRVIASVGSAADALSWIRDCEPTVAVIDVQLPDESGLQLVGQIRQLRPRTKVLIYTGSVDSLTLSDALETGADGIVLKPAGLDELVDAFRSVARGERHIDPAVGRILGASVSAKHLLTKREREVFALLARGESGEEIAEGLFLSPETVRTHIRNAMGKLQAKTRTEAVVRAIVTGEVESGHLD